MFYLLLAVLSSAGVALVMRLSLPFVKNNITMLSAGYFSCMCLSLLHASSVSFSIGADGAVSTIVLGIAGGALLLAGFIFLQLNVKINGVVLSGVFAKLGVLVPAAVSVIIFRERPELLQSLGFLLAVAAIILINFDNDGGKVKSLTALILLLLSNGLADAMAKFFDELGNHSMEEFYLSFTFIVAFALSVILVFIKKQKASAADLGYGLLLGIPNYYSVRFLTKAVMEIPAFITYPTYSVATIILISTIGVLFFKEKLSRKQIAAFILILFALILLNL